MENSKALYRLYRPNNFSEVIGQDIIIKILKSSIINNRISHAYLFSGPRGTGKTSIAKIFAKTINCENNITGDMCNECFACKLLGKNNVDIIEMDAASNNGVDEIREIVNNAKLVPNNCKYKVYIIDEVHMLSINAFNALLKTLEEPPSHVVFILATTEINKVPLTVLSRCQRFDFKKISNACSLEKLNFIVKKEKIKVDEKILKLIVELSDGGLRDAINLLEQVMAAENFEEMEKMLYNVSGLVSMQTIKDIFLSIINKNMPEGLDIITQLYDNGRSYSRVSEKMLVLMRDISVNNNTHNYFDEKRKIELQEFDKIDNDVSLKIIKLLVELINELKVSDNQKIIFEIYYLKLYELINIEGNDNKIPIMSSEGKIDKIDKTEVNEVCIKSNDVEDEGVNDDILKVRINNALATADKNKLNELRESFEKIEDFFADKEFNHIAKILSDCKIVVAGTKCLALCVNQISNIDYINDNMELCKKIFKKCFKYSGNVVAISIEEWKKVKNKFILDKKRNVEYKFIDEKKVINKSKNIKENVESSAIDVFGEINIEVK
ncbi:MAG: DNA polymerase III subunit gamma/tau [Bacilli bacterium]